MVVIWEYLEAPPGSLTEEYMNKLGKDRWELVCYNMHNRAVFKRPLVHTALVSPNGTFNVPTLYDKEEKDEAKEEV